MKWDTCRNMRIGARGSKRIADVRLFPNYLPGNLRLRTVGWECFLQKHGIDVRFYIYSVFYDCRLDEPYMCIILHQQFAFATCPLYACWGIMFCLRPPLYSNRTRTLYSNPTRTLYVEFFFRDTINYITKFNSLPHIFVLCLITLRTITTSLTFALTQTPLFALHDIQI